MIVADASVILKWVLWDEADREEALFLKERHASGVELIAAPDLLLYEVANVLPFKRQDPEETFKGFQEIYAAGLDLHSFDLPEFSRAMELSHRHRITTYDACYLALANGLRCRLVTADEQLLAHLKGIPHVVHLRQVRR